jgi:hypothetical protein
MVTAPNLLAVRMSELDKRKYVALQERVIKANGIAMPASDLFRVAMDALLEKHKLKVK